MCEKFGVSPGEAKIQRYCFDKLLKFSNNTKKNTAGRCLWYLPRCKRADFLNTAFKVFTFTFILHLTLNSKLNFAVKYSAVPSIQNVRPVG